MHIVNEESKIMSKLKEFVEVENERNEIWGDDIHMDKT